MATSNKLSPKVDKANRLRIEAEKADKKQERLIDEWIKNSSAEGDSVRQADIDKKYQQILDKGERVADKAYKKYHDYVKENFSSSDVAAAMRKGLKSGKGFMGKTFINSLEAAQKKGGKK